MKRATIKSWYLVHKWSSIVSTLFLLMLCATGLPLIFHDEIDAALGEDYDAMLPGPASAADGLPLDTMLETALAQRPGEVPLFMAFSQESPLLTVTTGPSPDAPGNEMTLLFFDRYTGEALGPAPAGGVMDFILQLHTDLFLSLPGMLFLGVMGLLFVVALVSGVVLYAPFMRRLPFGTLRTRQSKRVRHLDQHNLLGIVTLGWALVVGHLVPAWLTGSAQTVRKFTEHLGRSGDDIHGMTRTVAYQGRLGRALSATQLYVDHHATHHRFPAIPCWRLPEATAIVYGELTDEPLYPHHGVALREALGHLRDRRVGPQWSAAPGN